MAFRQRKSQTATAGNGVVFLNQFPQIFLRPYGAIEQAPSEETVLKRVKPNSCEWLKRPKVAMSEMAETLTANMDMLATKESPLLSKSGVKSYKAKLAPLMKNLEHFNSKNETKLTQSDVKGVLKFLVGADAETDSLIDDAMEVGAALFLTATHLTVARTFFCNPHQYANNIEATSAWPKDFKERPTMKSLKAMFEKECCASSSSATPSSVTPQRSRLLSSSDESESTKSNVED